VHVIIRYFPTHYIKIFTSKYPIWKSWLWWNRDRGDFSLEYCAMIILVWYESLMDIVGNHEIWVIIPIIEVIVVKQTSISIKKLYIHLAVAVSGVGIRRVKKNCMYFQFFYIIIRRIAEGFKKYDHAFIFF